MDVGPLYLDADYDLTGKILLAPLEGNGKFNANISTNNKNNSDSNLA